MFTSDDFFTTIDDDDFDSTDDLNSQDDIAVVDNNGDGIDDTITDVFDTDVEFDDSETELNTELNLEPEEDSLDFYNDDDDEDLTNIELEEPDNLLTNEQDISGEIENNNNIIGDPENNLDDWQQQTFEDSCVVTAEQSILNELTGQNFSEDELRQESIDNGWLTPGGGTTIDSVGNLLEAHGIDVEQKTGCSFEDISEQLEQGQNVMVALDSNEIWNPDGFDSDDFLSSIQGIPEQGANHVVQVIGIDNSDPDNPMVIINDPGHPEGQGMTVSAEQFMDAWEDSNQYMVHTTGNSVQENESADLDFGGRDIGLLGDDYDYDDPVEYNTSMAEWHAGWAEQIDYQGYHEEASTQSQYSTQYYENAAWEAEHSDDAYYLS